MYPGTWARITPDKPALVSDNAPQAYEVYIYPQEIEDVFSLHPAVLDVAVVGVPDEEMGERVVTFVQPAGDALPDLSAELTAYARERIAHFKVPREFVVTDDLPRTPTGKLVKQQLRDRNAERVAR